MRLIRRTSPILSTQVINEICVNLLRKAKFEEARLGKLIHAFYDKYPVIELGRAILTDASQKFAEHYSLSFWDGLIVPSTLSAGITCLYSEDIQNGLVIDGSLRIRNPFYMK